MVHNTQMLENFYTPASSEHIKKERAKARELRNSQWWKFELGKGICYYCKEKFQGGALTMDHILPVGRGGRSTKGNVVPSCKTCNSNKKHLTPFEMILGTLPE